jgi:hypothetical protein
MSGYFCKRRIEFEDKKCFQIYRLLLGSQGMLGLLAVGLIFMKILKTSLDRAL